MKNIKPTESELEILNVIWEKGAATVREVHEVLEKQKPSGYTTTLKLMQIMFEKDLLLREASGKTHIYRAAIGKEAVQGQIVQRMIDNVFSGSAAQLVMQALGNSSTSAEELDEIRKYLKSL
ncbi:BlaI/MecI/CopY family transcriptional regulator [Taibaiella chishuiensis]|uniref:Putative transcriptional regulator n=1 Tax=Taibaiella chishuiensis TaxID=1434707 RepID=A0A2P8D5Y5_9BACT|nr:BlaI/MecI/CopY family transcriptional regulator [Taibaiella chishuiensis]PSK92636.1 putative transcriptional regulator [Taibaiella chishuiensis]